MVGLLWAVVAVLWGMWSAVVWACQAVLGALVSGAGHLPVGALAMPESWTRWLPQPVSESITQALETAQPWLQALVDGLPVLSGGFTVVAWVVWALGSALLLLAGAASHAGLRAWQRHQAATPRVMLLAS